MDRWPERLAGPSGAGVDAHGKHLFIRFDGDLTLHSHLRMTGQWGVYRRGERWRRAPRRAWLVIRTAAHEVVEFDGPVLELMTESRTRFDRRLAMLGPDVLSENFDESRFLARLRQDDSTRGIGDALLDQRNARRHRQRVEVRGLFPRRASTRGGAPSEVSDAEVLERGARNPPADAHVGGARRADRDLRAEPSRDPRGDSRMWVFERTGLPCRRCGTRIRARGQGDDNRTTYWCP